jgi:ABC-2 type transport system permease protein
MSTTPAAPALPVDLSGLGPPIKGPSALGSDRQRFVRLTLTMAVTDFKLRFFGSVLGYLWQLMRPLMLFGVIYAVFSVFLSFDSGVKYYPVSLLLGIVLFSFFSEATSASVRSLVARENLMRKVEFPRLAVPLATVLTALFNLVLNLVPVLVFLLAAGGQPRWSWLEVPFLIALLTLFATGFAMLLSALFVRFRDVEPIWDVVLQALFYASPILYTVQTVMEKSSATVAHLMMCNPFAAVLQQTRHAFIDPSHESAANAIGSYAALLIPLAIIAAAVAIGARVFSREAPRMAENL